MVPSLLSLSLAGQSCSFWHQTATSCRRESQGRPPPAPLANPLPFHFCWLHNNPRPSAFPANHIVLLCLTCRAFATLTNDIASIKIAVMQAGAIRMLVPLLRSTNMALKVRGLGFHVDTFGRAWVY